MARLLALLTDDTEATTKRLAGRLRRHPSGRPVELLRGVFAEPDHLRGVVEALAEHLAGHVQAEHRAEANFRLVLFVENGGVMEPVPFAAVDRKNGGYDAFPSFAERREAFRLNAPAPQPHAVQCVVRKRMLIVESCEAAPPDEFRFLNDRQRGYLKSLLAVNLGKVYRPNRTLAEAALVVTTNLDGFFREQNRESLAAGLHAFGWRIKLALLMQAVLTNPGAGRGDS